MYSPLLLSPMVQLVGLGVIHDSWIHFYSNAWPAKFIVMMQVKLCESWQCFSPVCPMSKFLLSSLEKHLLSNLVYCSIKNYGIPQKSLTWYCQAEHCKTCWNSGVKRSLKYLIFCFWTQKQSMKLLSAPSVMNYMWWQWALTSSLDHSRLFSTLIMFWLPFLDHIVKCT